MEIKEVLADAELTKTGVWMPFRDGAEFLITYTGEKKYRDKLGRISARARRMNRGRDLSAEQSDSVFAESAFGTVLMDWKGLSKDGAEFSFNKENCEWLLKNSAEVRDFVIGEAANLLNFQPEGESAADGSVEPVAATKSGAAVPAGEQREAGSTS